MEKAIDKFNISNYDNNNTLGITRNPSLLVKMKQKYFGKPIFNFYGTGKRPTVLIREIKLVQGIQRYVIKIYVSICFA